jgi:hypothetical protein
MTGNQPATAASSVGGRAEEALLRQTATSAVGNSEQGMESGPIQTRAAVPSRPFAPSMGAITSSTLELKWLAPADNGSPISSYRCELVDAFEPDAPWTLVNEGPVRESSRLQRAHARCCAPLSGRNGANMLQ